MVIRLLRPHLRAHRSAILAITALQLAQAAAALYLPTVNADIIDNGVVKGDTAYVVELGVVMLGLTAVQGLCAFAAVWLAARCAMSVGADLRARVFDRVQGFSAREVALFGVPTLVTRTTLDVQQVQLLVLTTLSVTVAAPVTCVGGIVMALGQDVPLATVLLTVVPALGIVVAVVVARMRPVFRVMQPYVDTVARILREQTTGTRVIRAFVRDEHEQNRFEAANQHLVESALRASRLTTLTLPLTSTVTNLVGLAVVWTAAHRIDAGDLRIGVLTAFLGYLALILAAVLTGTTMVVLFPRAEVCAERIREVLDTPATATAPEHPVRELVGLPGVTLEDVEFRYPGAPAPVLRSVGLVVRPGEVTALVGATGSGKSTLLRLVARLVDPTAGRVLLGGEDVRGLDPALLARTVGLVTQRAHLFAGTVASNLRYGRPAATDEELWRALDIAQARDFVAAMDGGLDAVVAQGGTNLSGGQRQRLAIARVLVQQPAVYLLDDCFSALDHATEAALRGALAAATAGSTVLLAAQRVSAIQDADRIVVLDGGRVVGSGTHRELLAGDRVYREIVSAQLPVGGPG